MMVSEKQDIRNDFATVGVFGILIALLMVGSGFLLTAGRGIEDTSFVTKFIIYSIFAVIGFFFLFGIDLFNRIAGSRMVKTIVHDPEESVFSGVRVVSNPWLLTLFMFILFTLPLFFLGKFSNTFFSSIPFRSQQITVFASVWADSVFPALAENLLIFVPLCLAYTYVFKKFYRSNIGVHYFFSLFVIPFIFAFIWMFFHLQVYGSDEIALISTLIFGFIGVLLTMLTMSFIPWAVLHFLTNFMLALKRQGVFGSDIVILQLIVVEVILLFIFALVWKFDKKRSKGGF